MEFVLFATSYVEWNSIIIIIIIYLTLIELCSHAVRQLEVDKEEKPQYKNLFCLTFSSVILCSLQY